jgi:hypothetical protein
MLSRPGYVLRRRLQGKAAAALRQAHVAKPTALLINYHKPQ